MTASLRLFHGTSLEAAEEIRRTGFRALVPKQVLAALEVRHGAPAGTAQDWYYEHATGRAMRNEVSFSNAWRLAASYARNGPEVLWLGLCAIGRHRHPEDEGAALRWALSARQHTPVVVTVELPAAETQGRAEVRREEDVFRSMWQIYQGDEVVVGLPIPADLVVAIERTTYDCECPPLPDWTNPCPVCATTVWTK